MYTYVHKCTGVCIEIYGYISRIKWKFMCRHKPYTTETPTFI